MKTVAHYTSTDSISTNYHKYLKMREERAVFEGCIALEHGGCATVKPIGLVNG